MSREPGCLELTSRHPTGLKEERSIYKSLAEKKRTKLRGHILLAHEKWIRFFNYTSGKVKSKMIAVDWRVASAALKK